MFCPPASLPFVRPPQPRPKFNNSCLLLPPRTTAQRRRLHRKRGSAPATDRIDWQRRRLNEMLKSNHRRRQSVRLVRSVRFGSARLGLVQFIRQLAQGSVARAQISSIQARAPTAPTLADHLELKSDFETPATTTAAPAQTKTLWKLQKPRTKLTC